MNEQSIIDIIYNSMNNSRDYIADCFNGDYLDDIEQLNDGTPVVCGATKMCFMGKLDGEIIKVSIGEFLDGEDSDLAGLCAEEESLYGLAKDAGIGTAFAATRYIGTSHGVRFYAQELIKTTGASNITCSNDSFKKAENSHCVLDIPLHARAVLYQSYSDERLDKIFDFITEYRINDLHNGNIGMREDGTAAIFDFSGVPWKDDEFDI